ncbi:MAG TPA: hypothetical protein VFT65_17415 [Candidatus Angelobacter sp.]|nr:hypothetical protein [Candidatus Angelobacter sp.]
MRHISGLKRNHLSVWLFSATVLFLLVLAGCVISPRRTLGGGGGGGTPTPTPTTTPTPTATPTPTPGAPAGKLYVSNSGSNSIVRFDQALSASGNLAPGATISGAATTLNAPAYIALDAVADRLFIANNGGLSILIYDNISTKSGNQAPSRTIAGANTTLVAPTDLSLDAGRDLLYVADDTQVEVFTSASTTSGNIAPARSLSVSFTIGAILVDGANDRLFLSDPAGNSITVYDGASTLAAGPITANRTLSGAATHLATPAGLQIDGTGRLVVSNAAPGSITIYANAAGVTGNTAPTAEIVGSNTGFTTPQQIVVNTAGTGSAYLADPAAAKIAIYSNLSSQTGNIAPNRIISGAATTLTTASSPGGVALDPTR